MRKNSKITGAEKKLFLISAIAVLMIGGAAIVRLWADAVPPPQNAGQKTPSPNGYDLFLQASKSFVPAIPPVDPSQDSRELPESQWAQAYPTAAKEAWLNRNRDARSTLRQGIQMEAVPPRQYSYETDRRPTHNRFRELARMLVVESRVQGERGNWKGAAESAIDAIAFGHGLKRGAQLDFLVGSAMAAMGRRQLAKVIPQLNSEQARTATARLEKLYQARVTYGEVLQEDKNFHQAALREKMLSSDWYEWHRQGYSDFEGNIDVRQRWELWKAPRRVIMKKLVSHADQLIAESAQPYSKLREDPLETDVKYIQRPPHREADDPLVDSLEIGTYRWSYERENTANALLLVSIALHTHHTEHSRYPKHLTELTPRYLKHIPADPFGDGRTFRYSLLGNRYLLYSLGPDAVDDKGKAIEDETKSTSDRLRYRVEILSKGDFVAGVNH